MRVILVMEFNAPDPDDVVRIIEAIDPPHLPFFVDGLRIAIDPTATEVLDWLDE